MTAKVVEAPVGTRVELVDLRFGVPGDPRAGLFALALDLDGSGLPTGLARRLRAVPTGSGQGTNLVGA